MFVPERGKEKILSVCGRECFLSFPSILLNCIKSSCNFWKIAGTNWFDYDFSIEVVKEKTALSGWRFIQIQFTLYSIYIATCKHRLTKTHQDTRELEKHRSWHLLCIHWPDHANQSIFHSIFVILLKQVFWVFKNVKKL